jgi:hypothetical protein
MLTAFDKHKDQSPANFVRSIISYMEYYQNTSNKKNERIVAIKNAADLTEFLLQTFEINNPAADNIIHAALNSILVKMKKAQMAMELESFHDELGFLRMLLKH